MPSLNELVGEQKMKSDIKSIPFRHRYLQSQVVGPAQSNGYIRFTLPRANAGYLDVSTLRFRGLLNVDTVDASARLAGHDASILIDRVRVVAGSSVIFDQEHNQLISNSTNANFDVTDIDYQNYERALSDYPQDQSRISQVQTAHTADRICIFRLGPQGSFLNQNALIPLEGMKDVLHIDLYFSNPSECFLSTDTALTYTFQKPELNWMALYSQSLDMHYSRSVVSYHSTNYGHRYNQIQSGTSQVNLSIPSNSSNVSGIITFVRDQALNTGSDITKEKLENCFYNATEYEQSDFRVATKSIYDEPLGPDINEYYAQLHHQFPEISTSRHITPVGFQGNQFIHAVNLSGAPTQYTRNLVSGVRSSILNTDMHLQIRFKNPTTVTLQLDHYVISDVVYSFANGRITLDL